MTGPEHYAEAEKLLADPNYGEPKGISRSEAVAAAQVHATLALVAATRDLKPPPPRPARPRFNPPTGGNMLDRDD